MSHDDKEPGVIIKLRRDTSTDWATDNPVLAEGETGWDTTLRRVKLGDGVTAWNDLPWAADEAADVTAETARAEAAEAALQDAIDAEVTRATGVESGLDTRVDAIEAAEATYGDIVTHNASEFTTDAELAAEAATRGSADTTLQSNIDAEASARAAADTTLQSNITAEASTRATADTTLQTNITSEASTRATADTTLQTNITAEASTRAAADTALDARVTVLEAASAPGKEIGYAERTTTATTTATSAAGAADISGLSVTVTGKGRPVEISFYAQSLTHSVANSLVTCFISVNGAVLGSGQYGGQASPSTTAGLGDSANISRRMVLTDGVSYTFTVRMFSLVAGTSSVYGATGVPISLAVTAR